MKLLILCNDFPPLNSIGAQRPYSWFNYMKEFGIEPIVITKNWKGHSATPIDVLRNATEDRDVIIERLGEGTIIRVPLETTPSERMLLKYGYDKWKYVRKALTFLYRIGSFLSFNFDVHSQIYFEANKYLLRNKVDAIVATGEPFILFRYCYLLNKKHKIQWIADYRDGWKLNYVKQQTQGLFNRLLIWYESIFEKKYLRTANCITTIDPVLGEALCQQHHKPIQVIYNGFDNFYESHHQKPNISLPLTINHTGTLTPRQRVEVLLQALKELLEESKITPQDIQIKFIGLEYFHEQCKRVLAYDVNVSKLIVTTPRIPREEVMRLNVDADYLITFTEEKNKMINAKTYDYIAAKRPILIVPGDDGLLTNLISSLQAGESFSNLDALKKFLYQAVERKKNNLPIERYPMNEEKAIFYTRRQQTEILAAKIRNMVAAS